MGELLEIAKVLVSPCEKLMTMVAGAIGKAYEPRHTRKMADAHAYELSTIGAAMRELAVSEIDATNTKPYGVARDNKATEY